ncbi:BgTH12-03565 [Blumeria graminis f. sp. triticale]|uniref:BgtA-20605 n=3 Tax=Blumeria graminis TaxID=34373 RepID=A0A9X9L887_BLUGR|nr:hypothetical protein BGT96224_A20605 [Blumeria graminis f. sp. tritici 96224]CAD6499449.1 BgTH12-03565 [Blumeria graminis f. sp. triticale]VCU39603.1 BgtA-20605 [Blumeria graminis f. sp. tritici]
MNEKAVPAITEFSLNEESPTNHNVTSLPTPLLTHSKRQTDNVKVIINNGDTDSMHSSALSLATRQEKSNNGSNSLLNSSEIKLPTYTTHTSFDGDLEAQPFAIHQPQAAASKTGLLRHKATVDPMWPNLQELKRRKKKMKKDSACCASWAGLSKSKRGIITTLIILIILGAGLGVGFGISKRVGGGVVNSNGPNSPVLSL